MSDFISKKLLVMRNHTVRQQANTYEVSSCQETNDPYERFFSFFSAYRAWRSLQSVACADSISGCRCQPRVAAPNTYGGSVATVVAIAENRWGYPLRPRNDAVPSYRPIQRCGYACAACQLVSGSGEGQPTSPVATIAAYEGARAGVQSKPRALG
jgi:hypothetical protein